MGIFLYEGESVNLISESYQVIISFLHSLFSFQKSFILTKDCFNQPVHLFLEAMLFAYYPPVCRSCMLTPLIVTSTNVYLMQQMQFPILFIPAAPPFRLILNDCFYYISALSLVQFLLVKEVLPVTISTAHLTM